MNQKELFRHFEAIDYLPEGIILPEDEASSVKISAYVDKMFDALENSRAIGQVQVISGVSGPNTPSQASYQLTYTAATQNSPAVISFVSISSNGENVFGLQSVRFRGEEPYTTPFYPKETASTKQVLKHFGVVVYRTIEKAEQGL